VTPETTPPRQADEVRPQPAHRLPQTGGLDMEMAFAAVAGVLLSLGGICIAAGGLSGRAASR
jgi:hypothetical protein